MIQDGKQIAIDPVSEESTEPIMEVELKGEPRCISQTILAKYAKATGMEVVKLRGLARRAAAGDFIRRLGAVKMGHSMLVDGEEHIARIGKECDAVMEQHGENPDVVAVVLKAKVALAELWVKIAGSHMDGGKRTTSEDSNEKPQNLPPPPLMPVQINIHGNQVSAEKPMPYVDAEEKKTS